MALRVVILDMRDLGRRIEGISLPIQMTNPLMDGRVPRSDIAEIALEMLHVDGIESDDGGEQSNVGFGDVLAEIVRSF